MNLKSTMGIALTLLTLTLSQPIKAKDFPSFNLKADLSDLLFAALNDTGTGDPQAITLNKKKYTVTFKDEFIAASPKGKEFDKFKQLLVDLQFVKSLRHFKGGTPTQDDMIVWLDFYHKGLKNKELLFPRHVFKRALRKIMSTVKINELETNRFLKRLHDLSVNANAAAVRDLIVLTDLENDHIIKKYGNVSADGKSQTYSVHIGGKIRHFILTKV